MGFAAIEFAEDICGIDLYPWQRWLLIHALELDPALTVATIMDRDRLDPIFRFRKVIVLVARQNGKSTLSQVLSLFFMYVLHTGLVLGTAQDLDTAEEVWDGALEIIEETPELAALADKPVRNNGKKAIRLLTGERYKVKAANRRAGRGLSGDLILLDEMREHQSWDAWGSITKTTQARAAAQIWALSNAGDATSIVLRYLRKMAHAALGDPDGINSDDDPTGLLPNAAAVDGINESMDDDDLEPEDFEEAADTLGIFEWSAPPGCSVHDRDGWAQANPALGYGISERTIAGDTGDPEWVFRTEVLCQWSDGSLEGPFPPTTWEAGIDVESALPDDAPVTFCLDTSWDRTMSYIAFAGVRADGLPHVEVTAKRSGTEWVVSRHKLPDGTDEMRGWFADRATEANPMTVVVQAKGAPASSMLDDLKAVPHLTVVEWAGSDLGAASGQFFDLVTRSGLHERADGPPVREGLCHLPQPVLDIAAGTAVTKPLGDSWVWNRKASPNDAAPLVAATGAVWGAMRATEAPPVSAYEDRGLMTIDL